MAEQWFVDIENGFRNHKLEDVSIYKVPKFLVDQKQSAYVPQKVSLGPLHHVPYSEMNIHKFQATRKMFAMGDEELEQEVIGCILALVPIVRKGYPQHIDYPDKYLAWMLSLDACFILEIFRALGSSENSDRSLFNRNIIEYTAYPIITDILMLENQIPLFVLLKILGLQLKKDKAGAFTELCGLLDGARIERLFYPFKETTPWLQNEIPGAQDSEHLLDLIRMLVIHSLEPHPHPHPKKENIIPSASELSRAGIKFTKVDGKFEDIRIKKNRFYLPKIRISSSVETLLRNLMALETCQAKNSCVISRYVLLMCELIDSERDVYVLKKAGIIKSYMGSDRQAADLFISLSNGITRSYEDPFAKVREDVNKHYHSKIKVMLAEFAEDHCSSPWRTVSVIAGCMLLIFAAVQTIFSLHRKLLS